MHDLGREPTDAERLAVIREVTEARERHAITGAEQAERTNRALRARSVGELDALLVGLKPSFEQYAPPTPDAPAGEGEPTTGRRGLLIGVAGLVALGVGSAVAIGTRGDDAAPLAADPTPTPPPPTPTPTPTPEPTPTPDPIPSLFTVAGMELLLKEYRQEFGTWRAWALRIHSPTDAFAHVVIGKPAKRRLQWWNWDAGRSWNTTFSPSAQVDPNAAAVDLRKVNLKAALDNRRKARRSLNVEDPGQPDFSIENSGRYGPVVNFSVANTYNEYGFLVTDFDGNILERRPFSR